MSVGLCTWTNFPFASSQKVQRASRALLARARARMLSLGSPSTQMNGMFSSSFGTPPTLARFQCWRSTMHRRAPPKRRGTHTNRRTEPGVWRGAATAAARPTMQNAAETDAGAKSMAARHAHEPPNLATAAARPATSKVRRQSAAPPRVVVAPTPNQRWRAHEPPKAPGTLWRKGGLRAGLI